MTPLLEGFACMLVLAASYWWLTRSLPQLPGMDTEADLLAQGYTLKEAKRELRAQRAEHRATVHARSSSLRTASSLARLGKRLLK